MSTLNRVSQWWNTFSATTAHSFVLDLGSSQTKVLMDGKLVWDQPTCLALHAGTGAVVAVGEAALKLVGRSPSQVKVLFPVRRGVVADANGLSEYIRAINHQFVPNSLMASIIKPPAVCMVPQGLNPIEHTVYRKSVEVANFNVKALPEVLDALNVLNRQRYPKQSTRCLLHIGDQLTQFGIFTQDVPLITRNILWGGKTYTDHIKAVMKNVYMAEVGHQTAEDIKRSIGKVARREGADAKKSHKKMVVRAKHVVTSLVSSITISSDEFEAGSVALAEDLLQELKNALQDVPPDVLSKTLETGIFLSGGGALLSGLTEVLEQSFGCQVVVAKNPLHEVLVAGHQY